MFVAAAVLVEMTGKQRPSAQARYLRTRYPRIVFTTRDDGTICLRQDELDRWTLSKARTERTEKPLDLSLLRTGG